MRGADVGTARWTNGRFRSGTQRSDLSRSVMSEKRSRLTIVTKRAIAPSTKSLSSCPLRRALEPRPLVRPSSLAGGARKMYATTGREASFS